MFLSPSIINYHPSLWGMLCGECAEGWARPAAKDSCERCEKSKTYRTSKMQIPSDLILLEAENKTFCSSTLLLDGLTRHELKHIKTPFASGKPRAAAPLIRQGASRSCRTCILKRPITWLRGHARTGGVQECGCMFSGRRWIRFTLIYDIFKKKWDEMSNTMNYHAMLLDVIGVTFKAQALEVPSTEQRLPPKHVLDPSSVSASHRTAKVFPVRKNPSLATGSLWPPSLRFSLNPPSQLSPS